MPKVQKGHFWESISPRQRNTMDHLEVQILMENPIYAKIIQFSSDFHSVTTYSINSTNKKGFCQALQRNI